MEQKDRSIEISFFDKVSDNKPKPYDLFEWLEMTINPPVVLEKRVENYRQTYDDTLKKSLPCITISASFKRIRNIGNIEKKSGLICLDIDRYAKNKKNTCNICIDMLLAKELFISHPCCLYAGFSTSGDGVYAIIRINPKNSLTQYFEHFKKKLSRIGINIDESCKDYTRLRIFSVDKDGYLNKDALIYELPKEIEKQSQINQPIINLSNKEKVEKVIQLINQTSMDITQSYEDWTRIAAALNSEFGDFGENYFHEISKFHKDYDYQKTQTKYRQCRNMNKIKIAGFFFIANSYGLRY